MVYPVLIPILSNPEVIKKMDFTSPYENYTGILYPTIVAIIILFISDRRTLMRWKNIAFPGIVISLLLIYSYFTPLNCSQTATTICLFLFVQLFIVVYVAKTCITEKVFLKAIYDGFLVIVAIELLISFPFVFWGIDTFQSLFVADLVGSIRESTNYRMAMGTTFHHNRLGGLCAYFFVFFLSCWMFGYKKTKSIYLTLFSIIVLVLSQSRTAILATLVSLFYLCFLYLYKLNKLSFFRIFLFFSISFIGIIVFFNIDIVNEMFFRSNAVEMKDVRQEHYLMSWLILIRNHFLGCGMNSNTHYMYYEFANNGFESWLYMHSIHNIHLIIAVETGVIGFVLWIYYVISRNLRILKCPLQKMNNPIYWFTFIGMLTVMIVHGTADYVQLHYQYLMILCLFGAFYVKTPNVKHKEI